MEQLHQLWHLKLDWTMH